MKLRLIAICTLSLCLFVNVAISYATFQDGNAIMTELENDMEGNVTYMTGTVTGYIVGVADAYNNIIFSIPDGVQIKQLKQIVYKYMKQHPKELYRPGAFS